MSTIKQTIVDLFGLDKMSPEKAAEMANRLGKLVFESVLARVLPLLSEKDMAEYERIVASGEGGEEIIKFLAERVPDLGNIIMEEAESLRKELSGEFAAAGI